MDEKCRPCALTIQEKEMRCRLYPPKKKEGWERGWAVRTSDSHQCSGFR